MDVEEIKSIRSAIREKKFRWSAGRTSLSELKREERKEYWGLILDEDEIRKARARSIEEDALAASEGITYVYPDEWDWRYVRGRDWTTPVKNQGLCRSCVAFATVAVIESNYEISKRKPYLNPDLSEADLFFCGGGKRCGRGWRFKPALNYAKEKGILYEKYFPYKPTNQPCNPCEDRDKKVVKIKDWGELSSESQAKEWIHQEGPVITGMEVYEDFVYYRGGIYEHVYGERDGLHAIAVVGYNDRKRYWICKNSAGESWGQRGWFRIRYGECGIGEIYSFFTVMF
ncbi:MAG: peptidase C1 [Theionarchaea archaeon]|nr:peptidase C1 [Theionarchaea archaeon]